MTFIHEHRDQFAVALLLGVLNIGESTYYGRVKQAEQPCDRGLVDVGLLSNIYEIWTASGCVYGATGCIGSCAVTVSAWAASGWSG